MDFSEFLDDKCFLGKANVRGNLESWGTAEGNSNISPRGELRRCWWEEEMRECHAGCWRRGAAGTPREGGQGCPVPDTAGSSRFRNGPRRAQRGGGACVKPRFGNKGQNVAQLGGARGKGVTSGPAGSRARRGGAAPDPGAGVPRGGAGSSEGGGRPGGPAAGQGRSVWRKGCQRAPVLE